MNLRNRPEVSWAFYDWANSAFATTVMAGFFPVFFKQYWAAGLSVTDSTFWLGVANAFASLLVVMFSPVLGAYADQAGIKKRLLLLFALLGVLMSGALFLVSAGAWQLALLVYLLGVLGFSGGNLFYDALLIDVADRDHLERVSALGFSLGYLGGGLLFAVNVAMVLQPTWFGLADASEAIRYAFLSVALWWAIFSLPIMLFVTEQERHKGSVHQSSMRLAYRQLKGTLSKIHKLPMTFLFLIAYWFYIDGVDTIVRMAVDYGLAIGLETSDLLTALLITQFIGFPSAIVFGRMGERWGAKRGIQIAILIYFFVVIWAWQIQSAWEFYLLAVVIGLVQGGIQSLSRALYGRLIPASQAGEFFGFYNMLGKFAAILGPLMVGFFALLTGESRTGILSILLLFTIGFVLLHRVDVAAGEKAAGHSPGIN